MLILDLTGVSILKLHIHSINIYSQIDLVKQTFHKVERLHSKKQIDMLFANGESFFKYPYKVIYMLDTAEELRSVQVLISVSKRNFKKAVDRNKLKRLMREAYRKNKYILTESSQKSKKSMLLGLMYTEKTILPYSEIERKIILILQRLNEQDEQAVG